MYTAQAYFALYSATPWCTISYTAESPFGSVSYTAESPFYGVRYTAELPFCGVPIILLRVAKKMIFQILKLVKNFMLLKSVLKELNRGKTIFLITSWCKIHRGVTLPQHGVRYIVKSPFHGVSYTREFKKMY